MVWDLGKAMRKKEEFESARLMDFAYRQRARAARLLAREVGGDEAALARATADHDDAGLIALVAGESGRDAAEVALAWRRCLADARRDLIEELGDPTPHRLG